MLLIYELSRAHGHRIDIIKSEAHPIKPKIPRPVDMTDYRDAYEQTRNRKPPPRKQFREGLNVKRAPKSSFDTPLHRGIKTAFMSVIIIGAVVAVFLFVRSFMSGESAPVSGSELPQKDHEDVEVQIQYKKDSQD